ERAAQRQGLVEEREHVGGGHLDPALVALEAKNLIGIDRQRNVGEDGDFFRVRTTRDHVTARLGRSAAGAAFPPCGCARPPSCHRSPRATGGSRRLSALRLRTTSAMSLMWSGLEPQHAPTTLQPASSRAGYSRAMASGPSS